MVGPLEASSPVAAHDTNTFVEDIKNGNVTISTTTSPPVTPIPGAPDCPNPMWTETITDMAFTSATITLFQDSNEMARSSQASWC
jgi:hypothetical protein